MEDKNYRDRASQLWQQGQLVEVEIVNLSDSGDGVGRWGNRVVFVPNSVTGDRAIVRLLRVKPQYAFGKLHQLLARSPFRVRPSCIVADKCGGCQWQHIGDRYQQDSKSELVRQALERIGGFSDPPISPILTARSPLHYRNKVTYPLGIGPAGNVQAGYYRQGTHQLVNLNQCPVQDERLNPLLAGVKRDIQQQGWSIYDEKRHQGQLRHLSLRIGLRTGEVLLTLVSTDLALPRLEEQAQAWLQAYPQLVGVAVNLNPRRTNAIFGRETRCIAGRPYLREIFAGLEFRLRPETFFQVNTEAAELLLDVIVERLNLQGREILLDAYCGIGTFALPLAKRVQQVIGIEVQAASVQQARINAEANAIANFTPLAGTVESQLPKLNEIPDVVLLDPPRKGCDRAVLEALLHIRPQQIAYISCKAATLARDLKALCQTGLYQLTAIQPADFFPQTPHVECAAFLRKFL